mgnify:FL=1
MSKLIEFLGRLSVVIGILFCIAQDYTYIYLYEILANQIYTIVITLIVAFVITIWIILPLLESIIDAH